jgi:hypothetical protein
MQVVVQLDELHQVAIGRGPRDVQPGRLEAVAVGVVDLVAVPVTLRDGRGAVQLGDHAVLGKLRRIGAEPHGAAQVGIAGDRVDLFGHRGDDRVRGLGVELAGGGVRDSGQVAGHLDDRALQAQAQPEEGQSGLAGVPDRSDLALHAADPEAAGDADGVHPGEGVTRPLGGGAGVGGDPLHVDLDAVGVAAGVQRLGHRQVGVGQVDVLADQGDGELLGGVLDAVQQVVPDRPVHIAEEHREPLDDVGVQSLAVQHLRV